jgi:hypothetical protein
VRYSYDLFTHCGIRYAYFNGRLWVADKVAGRSSGWPLRVNRPFERGLIRQVAARTVEFRSANVTVRFKRAAAMYWPETCD